MRRRQFIALCGGAALATHSVACVRGPADSCGLVARDDGWPVASVNDDKLIDRDALCRMVDRLSSTANVHGFWSHAVASWFSKGTSGVPMRFLAAFTAAGRKTSS